MSMAAVTKKKKVIIDTDPGIDDAMAIFVALRSPELEVVGLTTIFGNVYTALATRNALHLLETAGRTDIPVAEGSHVTIKLRIASFVHGSDGLSNQNFHPPAGKAREQSAAAFFVEQANLYPGQVTVAALGPLINPRWPSSLTLLSPRRLGRSLSWVLLIQLMEMSTLQLRQILPMCNYLEEMCTGMRIHNTEGIIQEVNIRIDVQCPGKLDPLLLAST
ncbi:hypothetical protein ZWY2020_007630 [Hordeum vulgare]|nr:hypothetical protein ZWY2020_007630 [Hordeum vulgare]